MQVNIIPVIAKADTVSKSELDKLKIKIMSELVSNGVQIYQFPTEDGAVAEINSSMNVRYSIYSTCVLDLDLLIPDCCYLDFLRWFSSQIKKYIILSFSY